MNTTTIHIKTDVQTRDNAKNVAEDFGFSLTSLVNALLKQIVKTKQLSLNLEKRVISFKTGKDSLDYLAKEICNF